MARTIGPKGVNGSSTAIRPAETLAAGERAHAALLKNAALANPEAAAVVAAQHESPKVRCPRCRRVVARAFLARHQAGVLCQGGDARPTEEPDRIRYSIETPDVRNPEVSEGNSSGGGEPHDELDKCGKCPERFAASEAIRQRHEMRRELHELQREWRDSQNDGLDFERALDEIARITGHPPSDGDYEPQWREALVERVRNLMTDHERLLRRWQETRGARALPGTSPLPVGAYAVRCPQCGAVAGTWCIRRGLESREPCAGRRELAENVAARRLNDPESCTEATLCAICAHSCKAEEQVLCCRQFERAEEGASS